MKSWFSLSLCVLMLIMSGCSNDSKKDNGSEGEGQCTESTCKDSNILNYCEDGEITEKECPFGCIDDACVSDKCTDSSCKDSSTLLACENGKLKTVHCPNGCEKNACKEKSGTEEPKHDEKCTDGEKSCARDRITQCVNGEWQVSWVSCPGECEKGVCTGDPCTEGDKKCDENNQMICKDGVWHLTECPNGCEGGECKDGDASCTDGDKKCEDNTAMICEDGDWKTTPCEYGCVEGECVSPCEDGDVKCNQDELLTCKDGIWDATTCPNGCKENKCRTCEEGRKICQDNSALVCIEDKWQSTPCKNFCKDGECRNCVEGATGCVGKYYLSCIDNAWVATACAAKCTEEGCSDGNGEATDKCDNGMRACIGEELVTCKDGKWTSEYCSGGCANNQCRSCTDGEQRCSLDGEDKTSTYLEVCKNGQWRYDKNCIGGCEKNVCKDCVGDDLRCNNNEIQKCIDGIWTTQKKCPGVCSNNECHNCHENDSRCKDDHTIETCKGDSWKEDDCGEDFCIDGYIGASCKEPCEKVGDKKYDCDTYYTTLYVCEESKPQNTFGYDSSEKCFLGGCSEETGCENGNKHPCKNGDKACDIYNTSYTCTDGKWVEKKCSICKDGECAEDTKCTEGDLTCNPYNDDLYQCVAGEYKRIEDCEYKCVNNECICEENKKKCGEGKTDVLICKDGKWEETDPCETGSCYNGNCYNDCTNGKKKCSPTNEPVICVDGRWETQEKCGDDLVCIDGNCEKKECSYIGQKKCTNNKRYTCDSHYTWSSSGICIHGCNDSETACNPCEAEDIPHCDNDDLKKCKDGMWDSTNCRLNKKICVEEDGGASCASDGTTD